MDILEAYKQVYGIQEGVFSAKINARIGSTSGKSTDKSVSDAVSGALSNLGTSHSASSETGKTGLSGSASIAYGGRMSSGSGSQSSPPPSSSRSPSTVASRPISTSTTSTYRKDTVTDKGGTRSVAYRNGRKIGSEFIAARESYKPSNILLDDAESSYDLVLSYLLDEGFASTVKNADKIILNMSESWFKNIMELVA